MAELKLELNGRGLSPRTQLSMPVSVCSADGKDRSLVDRVHKIKDDSKS